MQFGQADFVKLYHDFGDTDSFKLVPAVRDPEGSCVEEQNCDWEAATLCAFDQAATKTQVSFLACMDEKPHGTAALDAAKACAPEAGLDYSAIESCAQDATRSQKLLSAASKTWNAYCPGRSSVPHTFVNDENVSPSYRALKQAMCKDGSTSAVCAEEPAPTAAACVA